MSATPGPRPAARGDTGDDPLVREAVARWVAAEYEVGLEYAEVDRVVSPRGDILVHGGIWRIPRRAREMTPRPIDPFNRVLEPACDGSRPGCERHA
ncbi:MAG TPA: hypothetical protein VGM06_22980 [Polyangiaceae bacterium]